jgi:hypothetical protein
VSVLLFTFETALLAWRSDEINPAVAAFREVAETAAVRSHRSLAK